MFTIHPLFTHHLSIRFTTRLDGKRQCLAFAQGAHQVFRAQVGGQNHHAVASCTHGLHRVHPCYRPPFIEKGEPTKSRSFVSAFISVHGKYGNMEPGRFRMYLHFKSTASWVVPAKHEEKSLAGALGGQRPAILGHVEMHNWVPWSFSQSSLRSQWWYSPVCRNMIFHFLGTAIRLCAYFH